mmetsp:Transcript_7975/g.26199  ORF Transcript_7975/g.26199 Transcript_7975/m.26199 type:complete len:210 (-) Transcript_7975:643-1272(-)
MAGPVDAHDRNGRRLGREIRRLARRLRSLRRRVPKTHRGGPGGRPVRRRNCSRVDGHEAVRPQGQKGPADGPRVRRRQRRVQSAIDDLRGRRQTRPRAPPGRPHGHRHRRQRQPALRRRLRLRRRRRRRGLQTRRASPRPLQTLRRRRLRPRRHGHRTRLRRPEAPPPSRPHCRRHRPLGNQVRRFTFFLFFSDLELFETPLKSEKKIV